MTQTQPHGWIGTAIGVAVIALVLALRWRRIGRERPLHPARLWIVPALVCAVAVGLFVSAPPSPAVWLACAAALVGGGALGWQRGKTMRIAVDPATGALSQATSPAALIFLVVLFAVKIGGRRLMESGALGALDPAAVTDPLIALALGLVTLQRVEMWLRARRLTADRNTAF